MDMLFVMDPIEAINIKKDTTFAFMMEAQRRGVGVHYCLTDGLSSGMEGGMAWSAPVTLQPVAGDHFSRGEFTRRPLSDFRAIFMRTDPPVNMNYIYATHLLDQVDPTKTLVVNRPAGLRAANEKTFILNFPSTIPRSVVTSNRAQIREFVTSVGGKAVIKPLDRMGGSGIFILRNGDPNLTSILETATDYGREVVMAQEFVPQASEGDKRILLIDGEPLGAILRVPQGEDFRGNMAVGGTAVGAPITDAERVIIETVKPRLKAEGLYFVGLDIIGERMTELNVTSPTGVQEMNRLHGLQVERQVFDWVAERVGGLG